MSKYWHYIFGIHEYFFYMYIWIRGWLNCLCIIISVTALFIFKLTFREYKMELVIDTLINTLNQN